MKTQPCPQSITRALRRVAIALSAGTIVLAQTARAQIIAYWDFNDASNPTQVVDKVNGHVGLLTNNPTFTASGGGFSGQPGDRALNFGNNGANRAIRCTDVADALNAAAALDQVTVTFWQRWNTTPVNSSTFWFYSTSSSSNQRGMQGHCPYGSGGIIYFDTAGCCAVPSQRLNGTPAGMTWLQWHCFAFVKNGPTKEVWIDGRVVLQNTGANPLPTDFFAAVIGLGAGVNNIQALLDDFTIWQGALSSNAVYALSVGIAPDKVLEGVEDTDGDSLLNWWEDKYGLNKNDPNDAALDSDNDGLINLDEAQKGTNPRLPDTDGDGLRDGVETGTGIWVDAQDTGTDPLKPDTDGDGLRDGAETNTGTFVDVNNAGTDPNNKDTDADGYMDWAEAVVGGNPIDPGSLPSLGAGAKILAYWDFNDASIPTQAVDRVHGSTGDYINGVQYSSDAGGFTGKAGDRAVNFGTDAAQRRVRSRNVAPYLQVAGVGDQMSIAFWQRWSVPPVGNSIFWIVSPSSSGTARGLQTHNPNGTGQPIYFDTAGCCTAGSQRLQGPPPAGINWLQWHHFVFLKDGGTKQIWIDGQLFLEGTGAAPLPNDFTDLYLGASYDLFAAQFRGWLDDVAIYGSALTQEQIEALAYGLSPLDVELATGDADNDGMPDWWEDLSGLNKNDPNDAALDADNDSSPNLEEFQRKTQPRNRDTDGDGLRDGAESGTGVWTDPDDTGTDPLKPDTDNDGLSDGVETNTGTYVNATNTGTNPLLADTDADQYADGIELLLGSSPVDVNLTPIVPGQPNLLALWDFNDARVATQAVDRIHGFVGGFEGLAAYSADQAGRSSGIGDRALNLGTEGTNFVRVAIGQWLSAAGVPDTITISFWQKWVTPIASIFTFYGVSPTSLDNFRGLSAHTPWGDGVIYWDTGGSTAGSTRISANINTIVNFVPDYVDANTFFVNNWRHFAFVRNGTTKQIWIDGWPFLEGQNSTALAKDFTELFIGNNLFGNGGFRGLMDDFAVYGSALAPIDIQALAQGASPLDFMVPPPRPTITAPPIGQTVSPGANVTFSVTAEGEDPLRYQWKRNGQDLAGQTNRTLTLNNVQAADAGDYVVNVSNPGGGTFSTPATLVVLGPPVLGITLVGTNVVLSFGTAEGAGYTLHAADSLNPPINWAPASGEVVVNGNLTTITLPRTPGNRFFILKQ
jgi:hypothetical protein